MLKVNLCKPTMNAEFFNFISAGCDLVKTAGIEEVKFSGESVVLLCSCTDLQTKPNTVKWEFSSETYDFEEIYSTQTGLYRCSVQHDFKNIRLHVKGKLFLFSVMIVGMYFVYKGYIAYIELFVFMCLVEFISAVRETPSHLWTTDPTTTPSEDPLTTAMNENERIM
uniref:Ig-like domain-containing protein n=1 Tax=Pygocentrus nattereri TaxID=42514 RepID=A0A3B4DYZ7_PYGNA